MSLPPAPGEAEHLVLLAILRLEDRAYGVSIRDEIKKCTSRDISPGALYTTLDRLEKKHWLKSTTGDPTPERGGRAKRYYTLTKLGMNVVREGQRVLRSLSAGLNILGAENA
jgi:DNA-binding PadR family transcriptional regulator